MTKEKAADDRPDGRERDPITSIERVEEWFRETDAAERRATAAAPKRFKRGEGIESPLPE